MTCAHLFSFFFKVAERMDDATNSRKRQLGEDALAEIPNDHNSMAGMCDPMESKPPGNPERAETKPDLRLMGGGSRKVDTVKGPSPHVGTSVSFAVAGEAFGTEKMCSDHSGAHRRIPSIVSVPVIEKYQKLAFVHDRWKPKEHHFSALRADGCAEEEDVLWIPDGGLRRLRKRHNIVVPVTLATKAQCDSQSVAGGEGGQAQFGLRGGERRSPSNTRLSQSISDTDAAGWVDAGSPSKFARERGGMSVLVSHTPRNVHKSNKTENSPVGRLFAFTEKRDVPKNDSDISPDASAKQRQIAGVKAARYRSSVAPENLPGASK